MDEKIYNIKLYLANKFSPMNNFLKEKDYLKSKCNPNKRYNTEEKIFLKNKLSHFTNYFDCTSCLQNKRIFALNNKTKDQIFQTCQLNKIKNKEKKSANEKKVIDNNEKIYNTNLNNLTKNKRFLDLTKSPKVIKPKLSILKHFPTKFYIEEDNNIFSPKLLVKLFSKNDLIHDDDKSNKNMMIINSNIILTKNKTNRNIKPLNKGLILGFENNTYIRKGIRYNKESFQSNQTNFKNTNESLEKSLPEIQLKNTKWNSNIKYIIRKIKRKKNLNK